MDQIESAIETRLDELKQLASEGRFPRDQYEALHKEYRAAMGNSYWALFSADRCPGLDVFRAVTWWVYAIVAFAFVIGATAWPSPVLKSDLPRWGIFLFVAFAALCLGPGCCELMRILGRVLFGRIAGQTLKAGTLGIATAFVLSGWSRPLFEWHIVSAQTFVELHYLELRYLPWAAVALGVVYAGVALRLCLRARERLWLIHNSLPKRSEASTSEPIAVV